MPHRTRNDGLPVIHPVRRRMNLDGLVGEDIEDPGLAGARLRVRVL